MDDDVEPQRSGILKSTSRRVRMIFSVMASPNRIDILRILNSKGPLTYSELKSLAGFKSKKESGKFAYHLRKLLRQSLVALNKSERRYTITNLGKLVLSLARQIEERSIIESGKMYVRTSHNSFEEFNPYKITQSLVREGNLPLELAQKITEEVENRIYKYQTTYLTGSLIRELVNSVLLEHGHEEYRGRLARMGIPLYDIHEMISKLEEINNGVEGLQFAVSQRVFAEQLISSVLAKDLADSHLSGDLHITDPGVWSLIPDTMFINIKEIFEDGVNLGGKYLDVSRVPASERLGDLSASLSIMMSLLSREASQEIVIDGLAPLFATHAFDPNLEQSIRDAFVTASPTPKYSDPGTTVSIRLQLGLEPEVTAAIIDAYKNYARITPTPKFGLVIDYGKEAITGISGSISEIILLGGRVSFINGHMGSSGMVTGSKRNHGPVSIALQSVSLNLPRLAFESNKDETYFRAKLSLLMKPSLAAMALRKKGILDHTRKGLHPILAQNTQFMQRSSASLIINLVGLKEAVFGILGYKNDKGGREILHKVITTAVDIGNKSSKDLGDPIFVCMTNTDSSGRFAEMDGEKYGKNSVLGSTDNRSYSQGVTINASEIHQYTSRSEPISESNRLSRLFNGGLSITLQIDKNAGYESVKESIEKMSELVSHFRPVKDVTMCYECGFKDEPFEDMCPRCNSRYITSSQHDLED